MKRPEITPGEWKVKSACNENAGDVAVCKMGSIGWVVSDCPPSALGNVVGSAKADITAISAVPDMLDALIEVRRKIIKLHGEPYYNHTYQEIEAALRKAGCK